YDGVPSGPAAQGSSAGGDIGHGSARNCPCRPRSQAISTPHRAGVGLSHRVRLLGSPGSDRLSWPQRSLVPSPRGMVAERRQFPLRRVFSSVSGLRKGEAGTHRLEVALGLCVGTAFASPTAWSITGVCVLY